MAARNDPVAEAAPVVRAVAATLGSELLGLYLYGSAVIGGLRYDSDLDFFAVTGASLDQQTRKLLLTRLMRISGRWPRAGPARPVELTVVVRSDLVPWRFPPRADFVYGEWLRAEFEHGVVPRPAADPDLTMLATMVRAASVTLSGPPAAQVLDPVPPGDLPRAIAAGLPALTGGADGDERNVVLTLARMWVTAESGRVVSKADAAHELAARLPARHAAVLRLARAGYLGTATDEWAHRREEVASFVDYLGSRIAAACARSSRE